MERLIGCDVTENVIPLSSWQPSCCCIFLEHWIVQCFRFCLHRLLFFLFPYPSFLSFQCFFSFSFKQCSKYQTQIPRICDGYSFYDKISSDSSLILLNFTNLPSLTPNNILTQNICVVLNHKLCGDHQLVGEGVEIRDLDLF